MLRISRNTACENVWQRHTLLRDTRGLVKLIETFFCLSLPNSVVSPSWNICL